jgi:DNA (cytosine-5)-methyltransferase 1
MSWLFSQVLVAEYLGDICSDGEQSVPLNGSNTQLAYLPQDKMTEFSRLSRFGMMFKPLTESLGEELLMSYLADFRAKTFPLLEKEQELKEKDQECGRRWQGLLAKYDPNTHSLRTVQCSLLEDLNECLQTWPRWGSMRNGECFQQPMLEQTTKEKEFGLSEKIPNNIDFFHTPNTTGMDGGSNSRKALKKRLAETPSGNWPTPTCADIYTDNMKSTQQKAGSMHSVSLSQAVQMWPTPTVGCVEGGEQSERVEKTLGGGYILRKLNKPNMTYGAKLSDAVLYEEKKSQNLVGGKLNPNWTEWLMGWPIGWTDLKPLETDKSHFVQQQLGNF